MPTAILSALPEEQEGLAAQMTGLQTVRYAGRDFHVGQWRGRPVVFALSRIGKVAAATTAAALSSPAWLAACIRTCRWATR
jgi:adenosylhomocysteine nucleosidase